MGFLDGMLKQALGGGQGGNALGGLLDLVAKYPGIVAAMAGLLSARDTSIGGGGLAGLVDAFRKKGLGDVISAWISAGPNPPITAAQLTDVLGGETVRQFAHRSGVPAAEAGSILAGLLPTVVDKLTPDGNLPDADSLERTLSSLVSKFG